MLRSMLKSQMYWRSARISRELWFPSFPWVILVSTCEVAVSVVSHSHNYTTNHAKTIEQENSE